MRTLLLALTSLFMRAQDPKGSVVRPAPPVDQPSCQRMIAMVLLRATSADGRPVGDATISVVRVRGKAKVPSAELSAAGMGEYKAIDDTDVGLIRRTGDTIRVTLTAGSRTATTDLTVERRDCHVVKTAGPDSIVLR